MGLFRTVSEINGDLSRKLQISPLYFVPPLKGFTLELGIGAGSEKTGMMGLPDGLKSFKIGLAVSVFFSKRYHIAKCAAKMDFCKENDV